MKIEDEHKRNKPKMEAILELLISKRDLQCFIGLSAVMFRYAEAYADVMFPFVDELKDRHPKRGKLTVGKSMNPCLSVCLLVWCVCLSVYLVMCCVCLSACVVCLCVCLVM